MLDPYGETGFDLRVVASPGDLIGSNDDVDFITATGNPDASSDYVYVYGSAQRTTPIEFLDSSLNSNLRVQWGSDLPGLEQLAIGGRSTVRGYSELEAAGDYGFSLSNELRLPAFSPLEGTGVKDRLVPFTFVDAGFVEDDFSGSQDWLASVGAGLDYAFTDYFLVSTSFGVALSRTAETDPGDARGHVVVTFRF